MLGARLNDSCYGTCYHSSHESPIPIGGKILNGSSNVMINGLPSVRMGDTVISDCGHTGTIITGSSKTMINGLPAATMTCSFTGDYIGTILGGSSNVDIS